MLGAHILLLFGLIAFETTQLPGQLMITRKPHVRALCATGSVTTVYGYIDGKASCGSCLTALDAESLWRKIEKLRPRSAPPVARLYNYRQDPVASLHICGLNQGWRWPTTSAFDVDKEYVVARESVTAARRLGPRKSQPSIRSWVDEGGGTQHCMAS